MAGGNEKAVPKYIALSIKEAGRYSLTKFTGYEQQPIYSPQTGVDCVDLSAGVFLNRIDHRGEELPGGVIEVCNRNEYLWIDVLTSRRTQTIFPFNAKKESKPRNGSDTIVLNSYLSVVNTKDQLLLKFYRSGIRCNLNIYGSEIDHTRRVPILEARLTSVFGTGAQELINLSKS